MKNLYLRSFCPVSVYVQDCEKFRFIVRQVLPDGSTVPLGSILGRTLAQVFGSWIICDTIRVNSRCRFLYIRQPK